MCRNTFCSVDHCPIRIPTITGQFQANHPRTEISRFVIINEHPQANHIALCNVFLPRVALEDSVWDENKLIQYHHKKSIVVSICLQALFLLGKNMMSAK